MSNPTPLELDLRHLTGTDESADAVIARLVDRGARIVGAPTRAIRWAAE